jgi:hypothetical protein
MSEGKRIKVTIDPLGKPTVEAIGFNGIGCAAATKGIEEALAANGGGITKEFKPEWNLDATEGEQAQEQQSW